MGPTDIPSQHNRREVSQSRQGLSSTPLVEESILRDLEDEDAQGQTQHSDANDIVQPATHSRLTKQPSRSEFSMLGSYRRPSAAAFGPRSLFPLTGPGEHFFSCEQDHEAAIREERSLLRDNDIIPPKHPRRASTASTKSNFLGRRVSTPHFVPIRGFENGPDEAVEDDETTPLVRNTTLPYGGEDTPENIDRKFQDAAKSGLLLTTPQREIKTLARYSQPLIVTFFLQYSLTITSVIFVGHIGKTELGAVSLGAMSANITGFAVFIGLATSLDTLCAQAYGSGNVKLVGLQMQRMIYFLWLMCLPIAVIWAFGPQILSAVIPEKEIAYKAGQYLQVVIFGAPGYAAFEGGKRFVQAQGLFQATQYVLLICAPLNVFLHWLFIHQLKLGYIGAPIALVITDNLLPVFLFLYVRFVAGMECWPGFSKRAFKNWGPMIRLALPGLAMVLAEWLAFEILTLTSSFFSATHLAAQSILSSISALTFQVPFAVSIAASTRVANLIGASLVAPARTATKVALCTAFVIGLLNAFILIMIRDYVPYLFTSEEDVAILTTRVLPLNAAFQLFDALATLANGVLRGLGRQEIGGYVNIFCYYAIAMPISFATAFGLKWELYGLWAGPALALGLVAGIEGLFIYRMNWQGAVDAAMERNLMG